MLKKLFFIALLFFAGNGYAQNGNIIAGVTDTIHSVILSEKRPLCISLPEGYDPDSSSTYPVIYLLDGGADEDFIHISALVKYCSTPWFNLVPRSIVVGIKNINRTRDFTFATFNLSFVKRIGLDSSRFTAHGGSEKFIAFIEKELQPYIQQQYKTNTSKTIIGESLGGLLATEILLRKPAMFNRYIIVSPSLWWGKESLLTEDTLLAEKSFNKPLSIYIGASRKEESLIMYNDSRDLGLKLNALKKSRLNVHFDYIGQETHATILHQAVYNAFRILYKKDQGLKPN